MKPDIVICPVCLQKFNMNMAVAPLCYKLDVGVECPHCKYALLRQQVKDLQKELQ